MSAVHDPFQRLLRLEQVLSQQTSADRVVTDPSRDHVAQAQRILQLTTELQNRADVDADEIDAVTMRLLLNDYVALVTDLRAIVQRAEAHTHAAAGALKAVKHRIDQDQKLRLRRAAKSSQ